MAPSAYDQAKQLALVLLKKHTLPTREHITSAVERALLISDDGEGVDKVQLIRDIQTMLDIWVPDGTELRDDKDHVPWLFDSRGTIPWDFWNRYVTYLEQDKGFAPQVVTSLDRLTDSVLEKIEEPSRPGSWDRRGMVVGQVQSGKTSHYTGLICKAVDAGYKLIIVLAGMHNSLRSQTQLRLDEGFLGFDTQLSRAFTQQNRQMGVGHIPTDRKLVAHSLTSSADNGDFKRNIANNIGVQLGSDPVILVVKKNKSVLDNLVKWIQVNCTHKDAGGRSVVRNIPLLLLDDEADNASVNTNPLQRDEFGEPLREQDVTAINGLIRKLLNLFEKCAYVGYTATPFANIFIYPEGETDQHGEDLFPRSFIINLHPPSNYFGPARVFGLHENRTLGLQAQPRLPIARHITDANDIIPPAHKQNLVIDTLPSSLQEAIRAFILSCAARLARGQTAAHNSMLVHVTRYTAVQKIVRDLVSQELRVLKQRLEFGDGNRSPNLIEELQALWDGDYTSTMFAVGDLVDDPGLTPVQWEQVKGRLHEAASKIDVRLINGTAADVLDYYDHPNGVSVIAIGGDKLSRGLTLEGLTVSYYLRASKMYDTLMQMGRWFGYRPGYIDLCRLYTAPELIEWYEHITVASEELRQEFDRMAQARRTPMDYGLKVRTHPCGLTVTGASKMRHGIRMRVSYALSLVEKYSYHKDQKVIEHDFGVTDAFIRQLQERKRAVQKKADYHWEGVPGTEVAAFLEQLVSPPSSQPFDPLKLREYIETKVTHDELTEWTVVLINTKSSQASSPVTIGGIENVGLATRTDASKDDPGAEYYTLIRRHILSSGDEELDLSPEQRAEALIRTQAAWETSKSTREKPQSASGPYIREVRPKRRGLLLVYPLDSKEIMKGIADIKPFIGIAVSFADTDHPHEAVEYVVNNIYWKEEFGD